MFWEFWEFIPDLITYHDVHAGELGPDLHENPDDGSVEHTRTQELKVRGVVSFGFDLDPLSDFVELANDKGTVRITMTVGESKHCTSLLPAVLRCQPARRLGEEDHAEEEQDGGDHLQSPGSTEGTSAVDEATAVADIEPEVGQYLNKVWHLSTKCQNIP